MIEIELTQREVALSLAMIIALPEDMIVGYPYERGHEIRALYYKVRTLVDDVPEGEQFTVKIK
jgi:hypothetical protein